YTGKKIQWSDQSKIIFVTLKKSKTHDSFLKTYVGKSAFQFTSFWRKQLYTGKGALPKAFKNEQELAEYVANNQGTIGYVSEAYVSGDANTDSLKIMSVE
ncbi:hypothetical protein QUF70_16480, partial [Desulfobacterales bacterium HSG17]|nr:hypothetical protein [Desulfobacterales bacterium HSG17]